MTRSPFSLAGRVASSLAAVACIAGLTISAFAQAPLSQRERTFLTYVFEGNEAKAVEYAQVAGINPNSIAGLPLSVWYYRDGRDHTGRDVHRELSVQRIVFGRFRQNPNPPNIGNDTQIDKFCSYAPLSTAAHLRSPAEIANLRARQEELQRPHVQAMAAGLESLLRYGLRDRKQLTELFLGCIFESAVPVTAAFYDRVPAKAARAGADLNAETTSGERAVELAIRNLDADLLSHLIRDGAQVKYIRKRNGLDREGTRAACQPRADQSVYLLVYKHVRTDKQAEVAKVARVLAAHGLSPFTKYGWPGRSANGQPGCMYKSFYDAIIDTGNLDYARAVKAAAEGAGSAQSTPATKHAAVAPAPPAHVAPAAPSQIGTWRIAAAGDGRPLASVAGEPMPGGIREMRIECRPGGRLEYVPVSTGGEPIRALWFVGTDDREFAVPLSNGHVAGSNAAALSRELLALEKLMLGKGSRQWSAAFILNDENHDRSEINFTGFSKMRAHMLASCRN